MVTRSGPPPFKLERRLAERVGGAPGAAGQTGERAPDGQVEPFDEGGLDPTGKAGGTHSGLKGFGRSPVYLVANFHKVLASILLDHLCLEAAPVDGPGAAPRNSMLNPGPEMRRQGVEVAGQAIARKDGHTTGRQSLNHLMDQLMGEGLGARTEGQGGDQLSARVTGDPEPAGIELAMPLERQFIELQMRQMPGTPEAVV